MKNDRFFITSLHFVTPQLRSLSTVTSERYRYDEAAAAIFWEDELPLNEGPNNEGSFGIRPILKFRTSLILGVPDLKLEKYWKLALTLFPNWIGFRKERVNPSPEIKEFLRKRVMMAREAGKPGTPPTRRPK